MAQTLASQIKALLYGPSGVQPSTPAPRHLSDLQFLLTPRLLHPRIPKERPQRRQHHFLPTHKIPILQIQPFLPMQQRRSLLRRAAADAGNHAVEDVVEWEERD